jgi:glycosyltransferase involved in cell wall biosynthesis
VITTHRRPEQLSRAIRSVISQGSTIREILVCEDGSDVETQRVVTRIQRDDPRIHHLKVRSRAGGPAEGRNAGVAAATSEWIAFLDDDDEWLPEKTAVQSQLMSVADVICSNALRRSGGTYFSPEHLPQFRPSAIVRANPVVLSSALVRRSALTSSPLFNEATWSRGVEDCILWSQLSSQGQRFAYLSDALVLYEDSNAERLSSEQVRVSLALIRSAMGSLVRNPMEVQWVPVLGYHATSTLWSAAQELASALPNQKR